MGVVMHNGQWYASDQPVLPAANRCFRYGDGCFESMRIIYGRPHLFDYHMQRLRRSAEFLKLELPDTWTDAYFWDALLATARENNTQEHAWLRLSLYRSGEGRYTPETNAAAFLIECQAQAPDLFPLNERGLAVDIFNGMEKGSAPFANIKSINAQVYVMAGVYKKEAGLDDCLILNHRNRVAEAISANIFLVKNGRLTTPPLEEGCIDGVMRRRIIELSRAAGEEVQLRPVKLEDLFDADELLTANAVVGLRWVERFKIKRYQCRMAQVMAEWIQQSAAAECASQT
jgi:branched-chain amino acid aminotransferase